MTKASIKARSLEQPYQVLLDSGTQSIVADEPLTHGGQDAGHNPYELLLDALGACTAITLRMYAARKQWPLEGVDLDLALEKHADETHIRRRIGLRGELSEEQRQRLLAIANACPVHKILSGPVHIQSEIY